MKIGERIKQLRKSLDLTQKEFGDRIGVKPNTIGTYEIGRNAPIDAVISLICREFGVSEEWLRTGDGEMFAPAPAVDLAEFARASGISPAEEEIIRAWLAFPAEKRREVMDHMRSYLSAALQTRQPEPMPPPPEEPPKPETPHGRLTADEWDALEDDERSFLAEYRRQKEDQEKNRRENRGPVDGVAG